MRFELMRFPGNQAPEIAAALALTFNEVPLFASRDGDEIVLFSELIDLPAVIDDGAPDGRSAAAPAANQAEQSASPGSGGRESGQQRLPPEPENGEPARGPLAPTQDESDSSAGPIAPHPQGDPEGPVLDPQHLQPAPPPDPVAANFHDGALAPLPRIIALTTLDPEQEPPPKLDQEEFTLVGGQALPPQSTTQLHRVWFIDASNSGCVHAYVHRQGRLALTVEGRNLERLCTVIHLLQIELLITTTRHVGRARYESCTIEAPFAYDAIIEMCRRVIEFASKEVSDENLDLGLDGADDTA